IGLGVTLSAWRGRSFVLLPLGLALAAPLVLVAFADVSLTVGRDDPGVIRSADGSSRTVVLRQGAGPVEVRGTAVAAGLRTRVLRTGLVADIASRRGLLRADRRQLHRLTRAYAAQLRLLGRDPVASGRRTLRLAEAYWLAVTPSSPGLKAADPALARLDRLRALRFDLLRAGWRTHSVTRGLRTQRRRLRALERRIAAASTEEGRP